MIDLTLEMIKKIESDYGSAAYIFNQKEFEYNYKKIESTFRDIYPNYKICYSYKTNYTPAICRCVKELGGYAEVVSDMEYNLALKTGYFPNKIIFNGPIKGQYLESHLVNGGINNIDRIEEANYICELARKIPSKKISTGIRVNFDIDAGYTSRFGIDINEIPNVINMLVENGIEVNGLHCHMSRARGIEAWKCRAKTMIDLINHCGLKRIEYISLGSGMYGSMDPELTAQFPSDAPNYQEYADAVLGQFSKYYKDSKYKPIVFTEPGTTLISKYIDFVSKVIGIKRIKDSIFILTNCSFHNLGEICQIKKLPIRIYRNGNQVEDVKNANFVGYTCLEQDVVYRGFTGEIALDDYILFGNVGGYSVVDKPPFILPNYPIVSINNGVVSLIKRQETMEDVFTTYVF